MKSILWYIRDLHPANWDYYYQIGHNALNNPFNDDIKHKEFIQRYFERSGKESVLGHENINTASLGRASHTTSIFFLGIIIYYHTGIYKSVYKGTNLPGYNVFPFLWFMTSLFHDFGYAFELNKNNEEKIRDFEGLIKTLDIDNNLLDRDVKHISKRLFACCKPYFHYRKVGMHKIDHGIVAGVYLFDRLVKIRQREHLKRKNNLFWGKSLENDYANTAAAIATHNIWMANNKTTQTYRKFGLHHLINFKPIRIKTFPLLYILGIVDTLDPVKAFYDKENGLTEMYILENILISFKPNEIYLRKVKDSKLNFRKMHTQSEYLRGWLAVKITQTTNTLRIKML
ncbi:MAG: hypothetical protein JWQ30_1973 [Sediminibacterium sp.]|nr:hypothetical protein [Sediminibacterium sp.]